MAKNHHHNSSRYYSIRNYISTKLESVIGFLFEEVDGTPLAVFRILFGFLMFLDIPQERGLEDADLRFGDENYCFFPLFQWLKPVPLQWAGILYSIMWTGTVGIMIGYKFRCSCLLFLLPYTYLFLLDKSRWNNHSYLFGLFALLLNFSGAAKSLSIDGRNGKTEKVPNWNYFLLKFQIFIMYFYAALKKCDSDWIHGYSMRNLSKHFLFDPFKIILTEDQIDYYMIHVGGLLYDLTVGFMLNIEITRKIAFGLSIAFHGLNSQIFDIGMFPYVCIASLILFCKSEDFPLKYIRPAVPECKLKLSKRMPKKNAERLNTKIFQIKLKHMQAGLICVYMAIQLSLPFSHSITKGYNNWTNGLYGYSWDMMVNSWQTLHQKITVVNSVTGEERFLDPNIWVANDRWSSHADQAIQYGKCIARNLGRFNITNIELYLDVWKSLNGRFQQRIYDPNADLLTTHWSPFSPPSLLLPLLEKFADYRENFATLTKEIPANSDVIFVADFPGLYLENYMPKELTNITLILLNGSITVEDSKNHTLSNVDDWIPITSGAFHRVYTEESHSCYMYTYHNNTNSELFEHDNKTEISAVSKFFFKKWNVVKQSVYIVAYSYLNVLFDVPIEVRNNE